MKQHKYNCRNCMDGGLLHKSETCGQCGTGCKSPKPKRKRPTSDAQREIVMGSARLLMGVEALTEPDYHRLNKRAGRNDRLLHAVLCAYAKHHLGCEDIGWNQLGDILHHAICNEIGDVAYCQWVDDMTK